MSVRLDALPELDDRWAQLEQLAGDEGIEIAVADFGGFRTAADTAQILGYKNADYAAYAAAARAAAHVPVPITGPWDDGSSRPLLPFGQSHHNYGAARDFTIAARPAWLSFGDAVARVQELADSVGLRSGAAWNDPQHLELPIPLADARARWAAFQEHASAGPSLVAVLACIAIAIGVGAAVRSKGLREWR